MKPLKNITLQTAQLSREAGEFIRDQVKDFNRSKVELKGKSDLVSYVDKEAEKLIVKGLKNIFPEAGFITEENTIEQETKAYTWLIDPLDGTTNFVHGLPPFAVSIGLMKGQEMVAGVIYEVNRDECFYAWKGGGSFLNETPISVTDVAHIDESLFSSGFPVHDFEKLDEYLAILNELMKDAHGLRRTGSAAIDLAYVACGRFEGFFEYDLNPWDVAAGVLIIQEAGGKVTDFFGKDDFLFGRSIVAAGPVHSELITLINKYWH